MRESTHNDRSHIRLRSQVMGLPISFGCLLTILGIALACVAVPGVFNIDEPHYLSSVVALRHGRLTVPGTEDLTRSGEVASFDPNGHLRGGEDPPLAPNVPPLYAFLAWPFSFFGWQGLIFLNILSLMVASAFTFALTKNVAKRSWAPWLAATLFVFGNFVIEYALGMWPHLLSVALCTAAAYYASRARIEGTWKSALAAGLLVGLATGVRYQNIFFAGCLGLGLLVLGGYRNQRSPTTKVNKPSWRFLPSKVGEAQNLPGRRRILVGLFVLGLTGPLLANSAINYSRYDSWNPISKTYSGYLKLHLVQKVLKGTPSSAEDSPPTLLSKVTTMVFLVSRTAWTAGRVFWAKVIDFTAHPPMGFNIFNTKPDPKSGAVVILRKGAVKKAWLQSSPWIALALLALALSWVVPPSRFGERRLRERRALSLVVFPTLFLFMVAGFRRSDAFCFNQRYFMELTPLAAVGLAWLLEEMELRLIPLVVGCLLGGAAAALLFWFPSGMITARHIALMKVPVALGAALLMAWSLRRHRWGQFLVTLLLGSCLAWSLAVHLGDDVITSRDWRRWNYRNFERVFDDLLPPHSAILAWGYRVQNAMPLALEKDVVILICHRDKGKAFLRHVQELLDHGRRVYLLRYNFPKDLLARALENRQYRTAFRTRRMWIIEIMESTSRSDRR